MSALSAVLDAIARAVLGDAEESEVVLGGVTLREHQREALRRVRASIAEYGGALLADEPGLGKTFVALALAREFPATIVVAPAALHMMWRDAARSAGVLVAFVSMETLSRREFVHHEGDGLVIVDEAHHVSNPATIRYVHLSRLTAYKKVLLLSATPVRNRRRELAALLALFMGPRALSLDESALSQCIVRRAGDATLLPAIDGPHWRRVRTLPRLRESIAKLPPPLPALDGREASALLRMTLARCWASSLAALDAALRRRVQRGAALRTILDEGRAPTRAELRAWVVSEDSVQLAFPMFVAQSAPDAARLRVVLDVHLSAIDALRASIRSRVANDADARARTLLELRGKHKGARIVGFTAHAATAEAIYRALRREHGIALLTSKGARTAGGSRPRSDIISALGTGARRSTRDEISIVITTDLLSEGVNLQGASVIVHLDVPWTPAGLDQRVGRAARMESPHAKVFVYGIAPPRAAERMLSLDRRYTQKLAARSEATRPSDELESLRNLVRPWLIESMRDGLPSSGTFAESQNSVQADVQSSVQIAERAPELIAGVRAPQAGFIAVVESGAGPALVSGTLRERGGWTMSLSPSRLLDLMRGITQRDADPDANFEARARAALARWLDHRTARALAGATVTPSRGRHALLTLIDSLWRSAASHTRAVHANRIARVRALVDQAISAGAEELLDQLARTRAPDLETLLVACESRLTGTTASAPVSRGELRALLLLRSPL